MYGLIRKLLPLLLICSQPIASLAQEEISGVLTGIIGPGTYIVVGDIDVPQNETLTIWPGTTFLHNTHATWNIHGTLLAAGTEIDSIVFKREQPLTEHNWGGLRFDQTASDNSELGYCLIEHCTNFSFPAYYGGGLFVEGIRLSVHHTTISSCYATDGGGFYGVNGADVTFNYCDITDNIAGNGGGIYFESGSSGQIDHCRILRNVSNST